MADQKPDNPVDEETFSVNRWAQRKAQVRTAEAGSAAPAVTTDAEPAVESEPELTDADMPPVESLDENSNYQQFFSPKVSEGLRRIALRKLFHSGSFNLRDGLDDYDEDYTKFEPLGDIVTADMKHLIEMEEERKMRAEAEADNRAFDEAKRTEDETQDPEQDTKETITENQPSDIETDNIVDSNHNEEPGTTT